VLGRPVVVLVQNVETKTHVHLLKLAAELIHTDCDSCEALGFLFIVSAIAASAVSLLFYFSRVRGCYQVCDEVSGVGCCAKLQQVLPIVNANLFAVELSGERFVVTPENVSAQIAREVILLQLEWVDDAREDGLARRLVTLADLAEVERRAELRPENSHLFRQD